MASLRTGLVLSLIVLAAGATSACSTLPTPAYRGLYSTSSCPAGTVRICDPDSLAGCGCGELVSL